MGSQKGMEELIVLCLTLDSFFCHAMATNDDRREGASAIPYLPTTIMCFKVHEIIKQKLPTKGCNTSLVPRGSPYTCKKEAWVPEGKVTQWQRCVRGQIGWNVRAECDNNETIKQHMMLERACVPANMQSRWALLVYAETVAERGTSWQGARRA